MEWIYLMLAAGAEVVGVTGINRILRERSVRSFATAIGGFAISFFFLALAMEKIPMSTAYAIWTGSGTAGGALIGMLFFNESKDWRRILFIAMIISAAVGLKLMS